MKLAAFAFSLMVATPAFAAAPQPKLIGDTRIHDPSVIAADGRFIVFGAGGPGPYRSAIRVKTSLDGIAWTDAGAVGRGASAWDNEALGYTLMNVSAPSIAIHAGRAYLYYALSRSGSDTSAISLMTNAVFDVRHPDQGWQDQGVVLKSTTRDDFNAIDPFRIDLADGRAFLAFGSNWSEIKLRELDPESGKLKADAPVISIASRGGGAVEAPGIIEHNARFYLFVSFDQCCKGVASTYSIRVGRADRIEGPYRDKDGRDMRNGGGSLMLATSGRFIGPGGQEPVRTADGDMLAYHYYDGDRGGAAQLQLSPLSWTADGWPELGPLPQ